MAGLAVSEVTGLGLVVQMTLVENSVCLVGKHMMQFAVTGKAAEPMPARISAWGIYDIFKVKDDEQIFLAVVSDTAWKTFCDVFGFAEPYPDLRVRTTNDLVRERGAPVPALRERLAPYSSSEVSQRFVAQ